MQSGLQVGTLATVALVREVISVLASLGETGYLDLITPTADAPT